MNFGQHSTDSIKRCLQDFISKTISQLVYLFMQLIGKTSLVCMNISKCQIPSSITHSSIPIILWLPLMLMSRITLPCLSYILFPTVGIYLRKCTMPLMLLLLKLNSFSQDVVLVKPVKFLMLKRSLLSLTLFTQPNESLTHQHILSKSNQ